MRLDFASESSGFKLLVLDTRSTELALAQTVFEAVQRAVGLTGEDGYKAIGSNAAKINPPSRRTESETYGIRVGVTFPSTEKDISPEMRQLLIEMQKAVLSVTRV